MTLPKTHNENIKIRYEALLGEENQATISVDTKSKNNRSLKQIIRNVELLTKAITSYDA